MNRIEWLLFLSQLPSSPSSIRVMVWRRMRAMGAISLHNGVWLLPHSPKNVQFLNEIHSYVNAHEGNASIFIAESLDPKVEAELIDKLTKNIEMDYIEFIDKCMAFLNEIKVETQEKKFTFAELDENEGELHKLTSWLRKIRTRDYFGNNKLQEAAIAMDSCKIELRAFARSVYANEGIDVQENDVDYKDE